MAKRTKAQRVKAAKDAWARRRAEEAMKAAPAKLADSPAAGSAIGAAGSSPPPVSFAATKEGHELFLAIANNGSLHRVKASHDALRTLALDILRLVG